MRLILGVVLGVVLVVVGAYAYFYFGWAPVATAAAPIPFEIKLAHMALHARIDAEAPKNAPFKATDLDLESAAHLYNQHCAVCHAGIDQDQSATAKGMFPKPPKLMQGTGVTDDPPGETYWKISNGIRLTGMPAYRQSLSDKEMWQLSLLLAGAHKLPESANTILREANR